MDVRDDLKGIKIVPKKTDGEEELRKLKRKKIFIAISSIILAVLVITYLVPGSHVLSILEGQATSYKLNPDLTIDLKNGKIVFDNSTYEQLKQMYFAEQRSEFKACLEGHKDGLNYFITGVYVPETYSQSFSHVTAELCNSSTIIPLHTHPYKNCIFSYQDIRGLDAIRKVNPDAIIGLMCEPDRFNFAY